MDLCGNLKWAPANSMIAPLGGGGGGGGGLAFHWLITCNYTGACTRVDSSEDSMHAERRNHVHFQFRFYV